MVNELENFCNRIEFTMGCWNWTGRTNGKYPVIPLSNRKSGYAHRWSHEYYIGPIPDGYEVDHLCFNIICVNPLHLEAVTKKVNMERTRKATKTICNNGHKYTKQNTYIKPNGCRDCRECRRARDRKRRPAGKQVSSV